MQYIRWQREHHGTEGIIIPTLCLDSIQAASLYYHCAKFIYKDCALQFYRKDMGCIAVMRLIFKLLLSLFSLQCCLRFNKESDSESGPPSFSIISRYASELHCLKVILKSQQAGREKRFCLVP